MGRRRRITLGCRGDRETFEQLRLGQHAESDRRDPPAEGLRKEQGRHLRHAQRPGDPVVAARAREAGQRAPIQTHGDDLQAEASLEGLQDWSEGVAIRAGTGSG